MPCKECKELRAELDQLHAESANESLRRQRLVDSIKNKRVRSRDAKTDHRYYCRRFERCPVGVVILSIGLASEQAGAYWLCLFPDR